MGAIASSGRARRPARARGREPCRGRRDSGLMTLEWLLAVAAIAGVAASSVLIVQRVVDEQTEVPDDPLVRLLEADIAAALIADEANEVALSPGYADSIHGARCNALESGFDDVVAGAAWSPPMTIPPPVQPLDPPDPPALSRPATCTVTPKAGLGGT